MFFNLCSFGKRKRDTNHASAHFPDVKQELIIHISIELHIMAIVQQ